jgi:hypothetical protein
MTNTTKLSATLFALWCSYIIFFYAGRSSPNRRFTEIRDPVERVKYF